MSLRKNFDKIPYSLPGAPFDPFERETQLDLAHKPQRILPGDFRSAWPACEQNVLNDIDLGRNDGKTIEQSDRYLDIF